MVPKAITAPHYNRLVLVGFMGAGKSTVGALLAARLNTSFSDSDALIESDARKSVAEIFEERGEAGFRTLEERVVADLLTGQQVVIALGGGALESSATRRLLRQATNTCVIHLDAPLRSLLQRCHLASSGSEPASRPLLRDQQSLPERYHRRQQHYRAAHISILTEGLTPEAVTAAVLEQLAERFLGGPASPGPATAPINELAAGLLEADEAVRR